MKKLLLIIAFGLLAFSCDNAYDDDNLQITLVDEFVVRNNQWEYFHDGGGVNGYLMHVRDFPALTRDMVNNGVVLGYIKRGDFFYPLQNTMWIDRPGGGAWQESFEFAYREGQLVLFFSSSDFYYEEELDPMQFKFVLMR